MRPTTCAVASLTLSPKERLEKILRGAKQTGLKVVRPHIKNVDHSDPFHHAMVDASCALGNGTNFKEAAHALQRVGTALLKHDKGCVRELERLQGAANRMGFELNLLPGVKHRYRRPRQLFGHRS